MQGQAHDQRIGKGVGDIVEIEDGRHLGLAADAVHALGDIEHQIPAPAVQERLHQLSGVADALGLVAQFPQGRFDGDDGVVAIEFGGFEFGKPLGQVLRPQVVGQSNFH